MSQAPPQYVLLSHSSLPVSSSTGVSPETLVHPTIQYCYADDPLPSIGPASEAAVLVMDFDPTSTEPPSVRSLSKNVAISAVRVLEANGAPGDGDAVNPHMYVIDTLAVSDDKNALDDSLRDLSNPQATLQLFKQRNAMLRSGLRYLSSSMSPQNISI